MQLTPSCFSMILSDGGVGNPQGSLKCVIRKLNEDFKVTEKDVNNFFYSSLVTDKYEHLSQ